MSQLTSIIEQSMTQYAGAVLQSRALVDARDGLKPSARQIFYSMLLHKLVSKNPYKKTANAVGMAMADFYIHGDSSCEGVIMRAGQSFAMRYPLVDVKGNAGSLIASGNWAAMRYTESRLSKLMDVMFADIDKGTVTDWRDSYDNTKQYPSVLPSKGFYNLCNGSVGVGIGMAASIPQFNLREMNNALIYLIDHPDCTFDEIYCAPDFATGGILYNEAEVKESLKNGTGFACKLRSVVEFDSGERCFVVKEIPYGVYTNTICGELESICNDESNPGIERFNDLTGATPLIKIYLAKKANPEKVLNYLYKNTSLQYYYGINLTMLDNGRFPRVFTWKEALQAHINHEREVYINSYNFDLKKIKARLHIIDGLLKAIDMIDEVIKTIKGSSDTKSAATALQKLLDIDDVQAKAILDIKLSRLAHLEITKLEQEKQDLMDEEQRIENILSNDELLKDEIKKGLRAVADKYGDERRTRILDLSNDNNEPIEIKSLQISLTNHNNLFTAESSTLYTQKRGGVGNKFKLDKGEYVINTINAQSTDEVLFFTQTGNVYHLMASSVPLGEKIFIPSIIPVKESESIAAITSTSKDANAPYIFFITRQGLIKKSELSEYNFTRNVGLRAIALNEGDEIVSVLFGGDCKIGILMNSGNFLIIKTDDIRPLGRIARGVRCVKLNEGDEVTASHIIPNNTDFIASISGSGLFKRTSISEFALQKRDTKGSKLQKLMDEDWMVDFLPLAKTATDVLIASTRSCIKLTVNDIPIFGKGAIGNKSIKLAANDNIISICNN